MDQIVNWVIAVAIIVVLTPLVLLYGYVFLGLIVKFVRHWTTWLDQKLFQSLMVLALLPLTACAGFGQVEDISRLQASQLRALSSIKTYEKGVPFKYTSLGTVKGLSCKGSAISGDSNEGAAMTQLKIKAVKLGADAILYPTCTNDVSVDWGNNCWDSWVCVGEAIKR